MKRPDFVVIGNLISSLQELDESFLHIFDAHKAQEEKIKEICSRLRREQAADSLRSVAVEELRNSHAGIRTAALRKMGFSSLYDLYRADDTAICAAEGVGPKQLAAIRRITEEFTARLAQKKQILLSAEPGDEHYKEGALLIPEIARYKGISSVVRDAEPLREEVHGFLEKKIPQVRIRSGLRWIFSRTKTKEDTLLSVGSLLYFCRSPQYSRVQHLLEAFRSAAELDEDEALNDFADNSAPYYAILENLCGAEQDPVLKYSSIPAQLAQEIEAEELDLRGFTGTLRAYQAFGAKYVLHQKRVLLGDEMGLGKTIEAIAVMAHLEAGAPHSHYLVVCPASVLINWTREIRNFSTIEPFLLHGQMLDFRFEMWRMRGGAAITNYESLGRIVPGIDGKMRISLLVIDEAHYIKNPEAKRTKYIHSLEDESERILMMTGTPLENKVDEMCELIGFVRPDLEPEVRRFAGLRSVPQFREILAPVYLRRHIKDVLTELPPVTQEEEWCEMTGEDMAAYVAEVALDNFPGMRRVSFLQENMEQSSKACRLSELCEKAKDEGRRVVVYSYFRETVRKAAAILKSDCVGVITGSTPAEERQAILDRFRISPEGSVLVCQVQAGGTGLNMQAAGVVIFCEPQIKPSLTRQAIARVSRMGQARNVLVFHLLCESTVDESMLELLSGKQAEFDLFADESEMADAAEQILDRDWIRKVIEEEHRKYLPAVINTPEDHSGE